MLSIEEAGTILDELAEELPPAFFRNLNGGILLLPEEKLHADDVNHSLFTMGEYHIDHIMGRYIIIYFGSFQRTLGYAPTAVYKDELRKVLRHEFTHHVESMAGERSLEIKDEEALAQYRDRVGTQPMPPPVESSGPPSTNSNFDSIKK